MYLIVSNSWISSIAQFLTIILILAFVLLLAYLSTRFLGKYQSSVQAKSNIKVIDSMRIANNCFIQIVKIGDKCIAIAIGKEEITFLTEIDESTLKLTENRLKDEKIDFQQILSKIKKNNDVKK